MLFDNLPALVRANASVPSRRLRFDDWFQSFANELGMPAFDYTEDDQGLTLTTPLPGWSADQLDLRMDGRMLVLRGEKPGSDENGGPQARFERRFQLGFNPDESGLEAELELGILKIRVPREPAPDATVIPVRAK